MNYRHSSDNPAITVLAHRIGVRDKIVDMRIIGGLGAHYYLDYRRIDLEAKNIAKDLAITCQQVLAPLEV